MITTNVARVKMYRKVDGRNYQENILIDEDKIISISAVDKTYIGGEFTDNGSMTVEFITGGRSIDIYDDITPNKDHHDVYMELQFIKNDGEDFTRFIKRYYFKNAKPTTNDMLNTDYITVIYEGVDNIGILSEAPFSYSITTGTNIIDMVIQEINNTIGVRDIWGDVILPITVEITDEAKAYIASHNPPTFINIDGLTIREVIRCIAEAYNCIVYCREDKIYIDRKLLCDYTENVKLTKDNVVQGSVDFEQETLYSGIRIEYYDVMGGEAKVYTEGTEINAYSISGNPFIQSVAQAQNIAEYQSNIRFLKNKSVHVMGQGIIMTAETHGFELTSTHSYDKMATRSDISGYSYGLMAITSREFVFERGNNAYNVSLSVIGNEDDNVCEIIGSSGGTGT